MRAACTASFLVGRHLVGFKGGSKMKMDKGGKMGGKMKGGKMSGKI